MFAKVSNIHLCSFYYPKFLNLYCGISTNFVLSKQERFMLNQTQRTRLALKFLNRNTLPENRLKSKERKQIVLSSSRMTQKQESCMSIKMLRSKRVLLERISEIMATSEIACQVAGSGLEITEVCILVGSSSVIHVYWVCSNPKDEDKLNEVLSKASSFIRSELIAQQVLSRVPPILFIRDKAIRNVVLVEKLLQEADFGEDFNPSHPVTHSSPTYILQEEISEEVLKCLDDKSKNVKEPPLEAQFPPRISSLKQDIFGVERGEIMNMVKKGSKALKHRMNKEPTSSFSPALQGERNQFSPQYSYSRTSEIRKWAEQYKKLRKMMKKEKNDRHHDWDQSYDESNFFLDDLHEKYLKDPDDYDDDDDVI